MQITAPNGQMMTANNWRLPKLLIPLLPLQIKQDESASPHTHFGIALSIHYSNLVFSQRAKMIEAGLKLQRKTPPSTPSEKIPWVRYRRDPRVRFARHIARYPPPSVVVKTITGDLSSGHQQFGNDQNHKRIHPGRRRHSR